jgi:hypothetical protein
VAALDCRETAKDHRQTNGTMDERETGKERSKPRRHSEISRATEDVVLLARSMSVKILHFPLQSRAVIGLKRGFVFRDERFLLLRGGSTYEKPRNDQKRCD